jgi:hypothetical protein
MVRISAKTGKPLKSFMDGGRNVKFKNSPGMKSKKYRH